MALKVLFLTTCTLVWLYWLQVPDVAGSFSSITCRQFRRVERTFLYDFVTYSEQVDKVSWKLKDIFMFSFVFYRLVVITHRNRVINMFSLLEEVISFNVIVTSGTIQNIFPVSHCN